MKVDNTDIGVGDLLYIGSSLSGIVVADLDKREFIDNSHKDAWAFLKHGIVILSGEAGYMHFDGNSDSLSYIPRHREDIM